MLALDMPSLMAGAEPSDVWPPWSRFRSCANDLLRQRRKHSAAMIRAPAAAPTAIPAVAPPLNFPSEEAAAADEVAEVGDDVAEAVMVAVDASCTIDDDASAGKGCPGSSI